MMPAIASKRTKAGAAAIPQDIDYTYQFEWVPLSVNCCIPVTRLGLVI